MDRFSLKIYALAVLCVLAMAFIGLSFTSSATSSNPSSAILPANQNPTHGPLINDLVLQYESDSSAFLSVQSGSIPAMEWSLSLANFATAESNTKLYSNSTLSYTFDGIAFNFLQFPYNNTNFRMAMADLMDYATIQQQLGPTVDAGNNIFNPVLFPTYYNPLVSNPYSYNTTQAMNELLSVPGMTYDAHTGVWSLNGSPFTAKLFSRGDDLVIREPIAQLLVKDAALINLTIANSQIPGSQADANIYGPAASAVISPGVMGAGYQTVKPPVFNETYLNAGNDNWGMYTFGWIVSFEPTYVWSFFNTQLAGIIDFGNYYNETMDHWTNVLEFANSSVAATEAASNIQQTYYDTLPYIVFGWQPSLFTVNPAAGPGWTGLTNLPTLGPEESSGLFFTSLAVHPASSMTGGTFTEAMHQPPTSLNPLFVTNWIWQVDAWYEVYDGAFGPFNYNPTPSGILNGQLIPWEANWSVVNETNATIGSGAGWYNPFHAAGIVNGENITMNFYQNATFSDGVPVTAYDYNASLYLWDAQGNSPTSTPNSGISAPPLGLLATYIPPNNPHQIQLFINSTTLWNIYNIALNVLPLHIFQFFNASTLATSSAAMDLTKPYSSALSSYLNSGVTVPQYLQWLPNLEVGSGPFVFQSWNTVTNVINMTRNTSYDRSAWWAWSSNVTQGSTYSFSAPITLEIYNPTGSTYQGVAAGATGSIPISNATGTVSVEQNGNVLGSYSLTGGSGGTYTATIPTSSLSPGAYELVLNASYTAFGLNRIAYQYSGLNVQSPTTVTTTSSTSPTFATSTVTTATSVTATSIVTTTATSTSSSTTLLVAGVVLVIIVVAGLVAYVARRRPPTATTSASST